MANKEVVFDLDAQAFASDEFRIYQFKVKRCPRSRPHDWTQCPFAHPGEKAKRRDPRRYRYSGTACPEFRRNGCCRRGDACPFAHGVFECWLHPSRYRTQMCTDGNACKRRVCFFAHCEPELRKPEDDPVWLQQQLQAELAAEQHQQQQQQAISILAALLGTQKPGADGAAAPANPAAQPLAALLGLKPGATPAAAAAQAPAGDAPKAADAAGNTQQGSGLTLLSLIDVLQKQQGGAPSTSAAPATAGTADEALQAQLSKLLLGSAAPAAPAGTPQPAAPAAAAATRDLPAASNNSTQAEPQSTEAAADAAPAAAAPAAAPAAAAPQIDVLQLLSTLAAPRTAAQAQNQNVLSAVQQLLQPTLEPTSLLAALLQQSSATPQGASLVNLLQQAANTPAAAPAAKPAAAANDAAAASAPAANDAAEGKAAAAAAPAAAAASKPSEQDGAAVDATPEPAAKPADAEPAAAPAAEAATSEKEKA